MHPVNNQPAKRPLRLGPVGSPLPVVAIFRAGVAILLICGWWTASAVSNLVPSPAEVVADLVMMFAKGAIWAPMLDTVSAVVVGFVAAIVVAVPLGLWLGRTRTALMIATPFISGLFAVPRVIVYPVLLAIFGVGLQSKGWLAGISAFFPILLTTIGGSRAIPPILTKVARSLRCGAAQTYLQIYLRSAIHSILVGLRVGASLSFVAVIVAELFAAQEGLGLMVQSSYALQKYSEMFAIVLLITILALLVNGAFALVERAIRHE